jgi:hypothetical protein
LVLAVPGVLGVLASSSGAPLFRISTDPQTIDIRMPILLRRRDRPVPEEDLAIARRQAMLSNLKSIAVKATPIVLDVYDKTDPTTLLPLVAVVVSAPRWPRRSTSNGPRSPSCASGSATA